MITIIIIVLFANRQWLYQHVHLFYILYPIAFSPTGALLSGVGLDCITERCF